MANDNELRVLGIDTIISRYFKDFEGLFYAMRNLTSTTNGKLYWFDYHLNQATFLFTIDNLCTKITSVLLDDTISYEYKKLLFQSITIKIQGIENLLSDNKFITYYNSNKIEKINFKIEYQDNNLAKASFILNAFPLFPDKTPNSICYGTLETFYNATLNLFNDAKSRINNLFSTKELNTSAKTKKNYTEQIWFKVGLLFATGEVQKLYKKYKNEKGQFAIITNELGFKPTDRVFFSESINNTTKGNKNIFSNQKKLLQIQAYCHENNISMAQDFLKHIKPIET